MTSPARTEGADYSHGHAASTSYEITDTDDTVVVELVEARLTEVIGATASTSILLYPARDLVNVG